MAATSSNRSIGVGILGGTGYGAGELLRLLTHHPSTHVCCVTSQSSAGKEICGPHPHLSGFYSDLRFTPALEIESLAPFEKRIVFAALPHEASGPLLRDLSPTLKEKGIQVIDLSGAYRLHSTDEHKEFYPEVQRSESLVAQYTYGITECSREQVASAVHISNPGCLATASILGVAPFAKLLKPKFIAFDTKTGSSGSGKELKEATHHPTRHGNVTAYKALQHQHEPEVLQTLHTMGLQKCDTSFIAQSLPIARGIYVTTHIHNETPIALADLQHTLEDFAKSSPFLRVRKNPPHLQGVIGTNFCDIAVAVRGTCIIVMTAIDNLIKGMAGQAIQNMNIMAGLPEETGIYYPGMRPY
ncbi:MAG: N-acetyl-gamma-glutamyl-phosphate reductase [Bdellovibrionales bacterium]|nr:N-acetyl-gamma-glutamyl-phosphate reductase [Bdellovibrionales bacterium]